MPRNKLSLHTVIWPCLTVDSTVGLRNCQRQYDLKCLRHILFIQKCVDDGEMGEEGLSILVQCVG